MVYGHGRQPGTIAMDAYMDDCHGRMPCKNVMNNNHVGLPWGYPCCERLPCTLAIDERHGLVPREYGVGECYGRMPWANGMDDSHGRWPWEIAMDIAMDEYMDECHWHMPWKNALNDNLGGVPWG